MLHAPLPGCRQRAWPCSLLGKRTWWWWEFDRDLGSTPKLPRSGGCSLPGGGLPQHLSQLVLTSGIIAMSLVSLDVLCSIAVRGIEEINVFIVVAGQQLWCRMEEMGISREHTEMVSLLGVGMLQDPRLLHPTVPQPPTTHDSPISPARQDHLCRFPAVTGHHSACMAPSLWHGHSPEPSWL